MDENTQYNPGNQPPRPPRKDSNKIWLIVGCSLIGLLIVAAVVMYMLTNKSGTTTDADYDDGQRNEKPLRMAGNEERELHKLNYEIEEAPDSVVSALPSRLAGHGTNGDASISLDLNISPDGSLTGTYWNILYNLEFSVAGNISSDGSLNLDLTQVKDHTKTSLQLTTADGTNYHGTWGKNMNLVQLSLEEHGLTCPVQNPVPDESWHIKGPDGSAIINADIYFCNDGDNWYLWYADQGAVNAVRMTPNYDGYTVYNYIGTPVAEITGTDSDQATLIYKGQQTYVLTRN